VEGKTAWPSPPAGWAIHTGASASTPRGRTRRRRLATMRSRARRTSTHRREPTRNARCTSSGCTKRRFLERGDDDSLCVERVRSLDRCRDRRVDHERGPWVLLRLAGRASHPRRRHRTWSMGVKTLRMECGDVGAPPVLIALRGGAWGSPRTRPTRCGGAPRATAGDTSARAAATACPSAAAANRSAGSSPDRALHGECEQTVELDRVLHRQLLDEGLEESVDDQRSRVLLGD